MEHSAANPAAAPSTKEDSHRTQDRGDAGQHPPVPKPPGPGKKWNLDQMEPLENLCHPPI